MKKLISLVLTVLILLSVFSACTKKGAPAPATDVQPAAGAQTTDTVPEASGTGKDTTDSTVSSGDDAPAYREPLLSPSKEMPVTQYPASATPAKELYTAFLWGDSFVTANGVADTVTAFARYDGINLLFRNSSYENLGSLYTYNLYECFNFDGTRVLSYKKEKLKAFATRTTDAFDFFVVLTGRDRTLISESNADKTFNAFSLLKNNYLSSNPDGKIVLLVPAAYKEGHDGALVERIKLDVASRADHASKINAYAERLASIVPEKNRSFAQINDAFEYFTANYGDSGIDLYDQSRIYPSVAGSYYMSCILYSAMFGKSAYGIDEYGFLDKDTALFLQRVAHRFVFGSDPDLSRAASAYIPSFTETNPKTSSVRYPGYENEVYPEYFDELFATAYAFAARGKSIQYDQYNIDRVQKTSIRRSNHMAPEDATSQNTMYLDCSGLVFAVYYNAFGYNFDNEKMATKYLIDYEKGRIYYRDGRSPGAKTNEEAIEEVRSILQPGDVIVYRDEDDGWGHVMLYIGNGTILHCSTTSHSGGGTGDYLYSANLDAKEYLGSVLFNSVEELFYQFGKQYIFSSDRRFAILRPLSLGLKPTEQAKSRLAGLEGIIAYTETTAPRGTTVNPGDEITFTFVLRNDNPTDKSVRLIDTLPDGLEYTGGEAKYVNGRLDMSVSVPAYGTVRVSFGVKVSDRTAPGTVIEYHSARAGGVLLNGTPVYVANTLTKFQQDKMTGAAVQVTASTDLEMVSKVYETALGLPLPFADKRDLVSGLLTLSSGKDYYTLNENGKYAHLLVCELVGGRAFSQDLDGKRPRNFEAKHVTAGDIILIMTDAETPELWLCLEGGGLAFVKDGEVKTVPSGTAVNYFETLFGQFTFCLVRPSMGMETKGK